jgi:Flp pilus assembly protein TadD
LDPGFTRAEKSLGRALVRTQEFDEATTAFEHAVTMDPDDLEALTYLIVLYSKADRQQDVIKECHAVLRIIPDNFGANFNLGEALLKTGDAQGAIAPLQKAIEGEPQRPGPHMFLADAYDKVGRPEDAKRERAEGARLMNAVPGGDNAPPESQPETNNSEQK